MLVDTPFKALASIIKKLPYVRENGGIIDHKSSNYTVKIEGNLVEQDNGDSSLEPYKVNKTNDVIEEAKTTLGIADKMFLEYVTTIFGVYEIKTLNLIDSRIFRDMANIINRLSSIERR